MNFAPAPPNFNFNAQPAFAPQPAFGAPQPFGGFGGPQQPVLPAVNMNAPNIPKGVKRITSYYQIPFVWSSVVLLEQEDFLQPIPYQQMEAITRCKVNEEIPLLIVKNGERLSFQHYTNMKIFAKNMIIIFNKFSKIKVNTLQFNSYGVVQNTQQKQFFINCDKYLQLNGPTFNHISNFDMINLNNYQGGEIDELLKLIDSMPDSHRDQIKTEILAKIGVTEADFQFDEQKSVENNLVGYIDQKQNLGLKEFIKTNKIGNEVISKLINDISEQLPAHAFILKNHTGILQEPENVPNNAPNAGFGAPAPAAFNFGPAQQPFGAQLGANSPAEPVEKYIKRIKKFPMHTIRNIFHQYPKNDKLKLLSAVIQHFPQGELMILVDQNLGGFGAPRPKGEILPAQQQICKFVLDLGGVQYLADTLLKPNKLKVSYEDLVKVCSFEQLNEMEKLMSGLRGLQFCKPEQAGAAIWKMSAQQIVDELDVGARQKHVVLAMQNVRVGGLKLKQQQFQVLGGGFTEFAK